MWIEDILSGSIDFKSGSGKIDRSIRHLSWPPIQNNLSPTGSSTRVQNIKTKKKNLDIS